MTKSQQTMGILIASVSSEENRHLEGKSVVAIAEMREVDPADAVFDPRQIADQATYDNPLQEPVGISHVFVNGKPAVLYGTYTGATAGKALRSRRCTPFTLFPAR